MGILIHYQKTVRISKTRQSSSVWTSLFLGLFLVQTSFSADVRGEHPNLFITKSEASAIRQSLGKVPLLDQSIERMKSEVGTALTKPLEVPPPGEAGGYAHERHKQNYREMRDAGLLFSITSDEKYACFIRDMLLKYSDLYPTLGTHPFAKDQKPGKLFHQMLNETVWLLNVSQAYDCIYDWLKPVDRKRIEDNVFQPMVSWFTREHPAEFDRIHNHGIWTAASVGMIGYVLRNRDYVNMALYGTKKDGKFGFLKQIDHLFSPDGYYIEGPYYARYALQPVFYFAEAIERNQPELKIFKYRDQILKKAFYSAVNLTFPNGAFFPINDASRTMNITDPGIVLCVALCYDHYGADANLLGLTKVQQEVIVNGAGLKVATDFAKSPEVADFSGESAEYSDGFDGKQGGIGVLRMGKGKDQTVLMMKYGVHGLGHGHFDKLSFVFYDQCREVIPDYGFARWINIEPKFGGRYLPENDSYAMQTIAHNTVIVDQKTQNLANEKTDEKAPGERHFFDSRDENVKVVSAKANRHYAGVSMQRTMFLIRDKRLEFPVVVDLYRLVGSAPHEYDFPIHFRGQFIASNFPYTVNAKSQSPLGTDFGYQHIWNEGSATPIECPVLTWLDGNRYYSWISAASQESRLFFGRIGANDPNFNLISEPMFVLRQKASDHLFASVIEPHGYFCEASESSNNAWGTVQKVVVLGHDDDGSVVEIVCRNNIKWRIMVNNGAASEMKKHSVVFGGKKYEWTGNYSMELEPND